uniref:VWFA domain-containing protein n=1 Tax=Panagrellus redivivus TaxID=6233 RepID=A0A7E4ZYK9_PANRE
MVNSVLFIAVAVAAALLAPLNSDAACSCPPDYILTINNSHPTTTIWAPTSDGNYTGTPCATNCSTTIAYFGHITEGKLLGASITVMSPSGLNGNNYVNIYGGNTLVQTISSDTAPPVLNIDNSNVTIEFILKDPVTVYIFSSPIDREAPASTTPSPATTPVYNGSYPVNPALVKLDLIIGIDASQNNLASFQDAKNTIKEVVNTFGYSDDSVRLSLFRFTPSDTLPYGFFDIPWTLNAATFATSLDSIVPYPGAQSDYFTQLNVGLFKAIDNNYKFRDNTERVLLIFTGSDAAAVNNDTLTAVKGKINADDLRIVLANTNKSLSLSNVNFKQLLSLNDANPKPLSTYQFILDDSSQVQNLLNSTIFNGNALSQLPGTSPQSTASAADVIVPDGFQRYTIFINDVRKYVPEFNKIIKLTFAYFETNYNTDFIIISVDGKEVARLSGQYGYEPYFCLAATDNVEVTFTTSYGNVYKGYKSTAEAVLTCGPGKSIEYSKSGKIMKYIKTSDVSTYLGSPLY